MFYPLSMAKIYMSYPFSTAIILFVGSGRGWSGTPS